MPRVPCGVTVRGCPVYVASGSVREEGIVNYDGFRAVWLQASSAAGLVELVDTAMETVELGNMRRKHRMCVGWPGRRLIGSFEVFAHLAWEWEALQSARSAVCEEGVLAQLLGEVGYEQATEPPWVWVDVELVARLDGVLLPLPEAEVWRRWEANVTARLASLWPIEEGAPHSWRSEPLCRLRCGVGGRLCVDSIELSLEQGVILPRRWMLRPGWHGVDPGESEDDTVHEQLADVASRVYEALQVWGECLAHLEPFVR